MSIDPISATTSATRCPLISRGSACRLQNDGGRTRNRYGVFDLPSLTMKYPISLGRLDRVVGLAGRRLDQSRHLADDRPLGQPVERLTDDADGLTELLEADEIAIVGVAGRSDRDVELEVGVGGVGFVLADVARDARPRSAGPLRPMAIASGRK